jgi:putative aldouronate transport system permease protein
MQLYSREVQTSIKPQSNLYAHLQKTWMLYSMVLPGVLYFIIFRYVPLGGAMIAFQDYQIFNGMWNSPWVGFKHFENMFAYHDFVIILKNTLLIGTYQLIFGFPAPILFALLLNEVRLRLLKRSVQTFFYLPHFLSWVIVGGLMFELLATKGMVNNILLWFGKDPILFLQKESFFRSIVVLSSIWKETGWSAIIYLAAISGVNPSLYEAATIDGANKLKQVWHITIPGIVPTIMILLLLKIGNFLELGFEQIYVLLTPLTYSTGDIIDTYVFRNGILQGQYSFTTAVGLFKSIVGFTLLYVCNKIAKKTTDTGGLF